MGSQKILFSDPVDQADTRGHITFISTPDGLFEVKSTWSPMVTLKGMIKGIFLLIGPGSEKWLPERPLASESVQSCSILAFFGGENSTYGPWKPFLGSQTHERKDVSAQCLQGNR